MTERKTPLTREQEADEIVRRLKIPPKSQSEQLADELVKALSSSIAEEIDQEILEKLLKKMSGKHGS